MANSFGRNYSTRQTSGGTDIYDLNDGTSGTPNWSSGWVNTDGTTSVANGASLNFTHNLGTSDIVFNVYAATDVNGSDAVDVSNHEISQTDVPRSDYGSMVRLTSNNAINVVLASQGLLIPNVGATYNVTASNYGGTGYTHIKVVAIAGGGAQTGFNPSTYTGQESVTFPNGMIMKMGEVSSSASSTTITFASAFPNSVVSVIASSIKAGAANNDSDANISSVSTTGFTVTRVTTTGGHTGIYWQAIGH